MTSQSQSLLNLEHEISRLVKDQRKSHGLPNWDMQHTSCIASVARTHSRNIIEKRMYTHYFDGAPEERLRKFGIHFMDQGENQYYDWAGKLADGTYAKDAVNWWMNSGGHRANILNPNWNFTGVGVWRGKVETTDPNGVSWCPHQLNQPAPKSCDTIAVTQDFTKTDRAQYVSPHFEVDFSEVDDIVFVYVNNEEKWHWDSDFKKQPDPARQDVTRFLTGRSDEIRIRLNNKGCYATSLKMDLTLNGWRLDRRSLWPPADYRLNCGFVDEVDWRYRLNKTTGSYQRVR